MNDVSLNLTNGFIIEFSAFESATFCLDVLPPPLVSRPCPRLQVLLEAEVVAAGRHMPLMAAEEPLLLVARDGLEHDCLFIWNGNNSKWKIIIITLF